MGDPDNKAALDSSMPNTAGLSAPGLPLLDNKAALDSSMPTAWNSLSEGLRRSRYPGNAPQPFIQL